MKKLDNNTFLEWAASKGIFLERRYSPPQTLEFKDSWSLHLPLPTDARKLRNLITGCLEQLPDDDVYLWKRGGKWYAEKSMSERLYFREGVGNLLSGIGLDDGDYTLCFASAEKALLAVMLYLFVSIAWKVPDDLFVVSGQADVVFYFDHDDYLHISCPDPTTSKRLEDWLRQILDPEALLKLTHRRDERIF